MIEHKIVTEKRSDDWIAYLSGVRIVWESGKTEEEAIGKLVVSLRAFLTYSYDVVVRGN